uniref:uracil-DNA glycosylase n=1 Tax=Stappia sp. TaxID=1870903 RepID=UPI003BA9AB3C
MGPSRPTDETASGGFEPPREVVRGLEALLDFYLASGADAWGDDVPADAFALSEQARMQAEARNRPATRPGGSAPAAGGARSGEVPAERSAPMSTDPRDYLKPAAGEREKPAAPVAGGTIALPTDETVDAAREAAARAASLEELRDILSRFEGCNLRLTAKSLVFADGNPQARVMFVGEAPGREEDRQGLPFVGRSGKLLDLMMAAIGLDRTSAWITNVVPWRPPGNRTPSPQETEICKPFIMRQIELIRPEVLVFLGGASAATLAGTNQGILRLRGRWLQVPLRAEAGGGAVRALATLHPAYLLRNPLQKRFAWRDFLALREALDAGPAGEGNGAGGAEG